MTAIRLGRFSSEGENMKKRATRDGVFERSDCKGWYASFVDADGKRRKQRVQAHTRSQAMDALALIKARVQKEELTGVKQVSEMTTAELFARYKRYQKSRSMPTTLERMDSLLKTLMSDLPHRLKDIDRLAVDEYIGTARKAQPRHQCAKR
jgi:hypothetical protein